MDHPEPVPEATRFEPSLLARLKFATGAQAVAYLRALAHQNGLRLAACDSLTNDIIRLHCRIASPGHGEKTKRTGGEFQFKLHRTDVGYIIRPGVRREHNPPLLTRAHGLE